MPQRRASDGRGSASKKFQGSPPQLVGHGPSRGLPAFSKASLERGLQSKQGPRVHCSQTLYSAEEHTSNSLLLRRKWVRHGNRIVFLVLLGVQGEGQSGLLKPYLRTAAADEVLFLFRPAALHKLKDSPRPAAPGVLLPLPACLGNVCTSGSGVWAHRTECMIKSLLEEPHFTHLRLCPTCSGTPGPSPRTWPS